MEKTNPPREPRPPDENPAAPRRDSGNTTDATEQSSAKAAVGALFRSAREAQGLSQAQVAYLTNDSQGQISRTTISDIERGVSFPNLEILFSLSKVLHIEPTEALERVDLAMAAPVDVTELSLDSLQERADQLFWAGDFRTALAVYDAMQQRLVLDPPSDDHEGRRRSAKIEILRAVTLRQSSALHASKAAAERATEWAEGIPELQAEAYMILASIQSQQGLIALALLTAEQAVSLADRGPARLSGQTWCQKASVFYRARRFEEARTAYLHARKSALEAGDHHNLVVIEGGIGSCLIELGAVDQARRHFKQAVDLARQHVDPEAEAFWLIELGRLALQDEQADEADRLATAALRRVKPGGRKLTVFRAEWLRHLAAKQQDPDIDDAKRLNLLNKLYSQVRSHQALDVVREFEEYAIDLAKEKNHDLED